MAASCFCFQLDRLVQQCVFFFLNILSPLPRAGRTAAGAQEALPRPLIKIKSIQDHAYDRAGNTGTQRLYPGKPHELLESPFSR